MLTERDVLSLRNVGDADLTLLWSWANDPETRKWSFQTHAITWAEHVEWYRRLRHDPDSLLYIVEGRGLSVALVRFAVGGAESIVSITVAPSARGRGIGTAALKLACRRLVAERGPLPIVALI